MSVIHPELTDVQPNSYSDLCVMQSAAGYYVGTYFREQEHGMDYLCPGSRDSGYFASAGIASSFLNYLNGTDRDDTESDDEPDDGRSHRDIERNSGDHKGYNGPFDDTDTDTDTDNDD